jgi:4,5-dihydroxyphthalate decarboxylase
MPTDPRLKSVIPAPDAAAQGWYSKHHTVPVNHMVVVKSALSKSDPRAVREVFRMLHESKKAAGLPRAGAIDMLPFGFDAVKPALALMSSYALEMKIIPRRYSVEELFDDTTRALQG